MGGESRGPALSFGSPESSLVPWQVSTDAAPPVELRRPMAGKLLTTAVTTALVVGFLVVLGAFIGFLGPLLLAGAVVACGVLAVYLPKYGESGKDGWIYRPYLVLLDADGRRLHRLRCATWSESRLETLAALLPSTTKLKVPGRIDRAGLRKFDRRYPGIRRGGT